MQAPIITALFAGIATIIAVILSMLVSHQRRKNHIMFGTLDPCLPFQHALRAQANFIEYTSFALILLCLLELNHEANFALYIYGSAFIVGRILHAWGISRTQGVSIGRVLGMLCTTPLLLLMAIRCIFKFIQG